jgi:hypothetical protein
VPSGAKVLPFLHEEEVHTEEAGAAGQDLSLSLLEYIILEAS